jgi:hypothetical protein
MNDRAWDWVEETYPDGIRLIFVRRIAPERIFETFNTDLATARDVTADDAHNTVPYPWIRVGCAGDWTFSIDSCIFSFFQIDAQIRNLSSGTELAMHEGGIELSHFYYFEGGQEVTSFEPLMSPWRAGSDPDRFVPYMRQVGLDVDPPSDNAELGGSPTLALLNMLTLALDIQLSREQALGPLPTAHVGWDPTA